MELFEIVSRCLPHKNRAAHKPCRVVLQTREGKHLGFSLFSPAFHSPHGTCQFAILPNDTTVWDSDVAQTLFAARACGEHQFEQLKGQVVARLNGQVHIVFDQNGDLYHAPSETLLGRWLPVAN